MKISKRCILVLLFAMGGSFTVSAVEVKQQEMLEKSRVWHGQKGWEIVYIPVIGGGDEFECSLNWNPENSNHRLMWTWNRMTNLKVTFMGPAPPGETSGSKTVSSFKVSIDGRTLVDKLAGYPVIKNLRGIGDMLMIPEMYIAWDHNNEGYDKGPETRDIFNLLRHGRVLVIKTYGQTYTEDLRGVGSALDLFNKCIDYQEEQEGLR